MSQVHLDTRGLRDLIAKVEDLPTRKVKVGLLASTAGRTAIRGRIDHNPSLGLVHEFGDPKHNIPQRSFIFMPLTMRIGEEMKVLGWNLVPTLMKEGVAQTLAALGRIAEKTIDRAFMTGGWGAWPSLQRETIMRKRRMGASLKTLIESQQMREAITSEVI